MNSWYISFSESKKAQMEFGEHSSPGIWKLKTWLSVGKIMLIAFGDAEGLEYIELYKKAHY